MLGCAAMNLGGSDAAIFIAMDRGYFAEQGIELDVTRGSSELVPSLATGEIDVLAPAVSAALLNAMALGKPVLATSVGGMAEIVEDGVTGRLVLPSTDAIASGLEELIADASLRDRLGKAAREWVTSHLTWDDIASRHITLVRGS